MAKGFCDDFSKQVDDLVDIWLEGTQENKSGVQLSTEIDGLHSYGQASGCLAKTKRIHPQQV